MSTADSPLDTAVAWLGDGLAVALALVVDTWSGSPRPPGSLLTATAEGRFAGSVSGGCIEGAVVAEARDVIRTGRPRFCDYTIGDDQARSVGLACGGALRVLMIPVREPALPAAILSSRPCALAVDPVSGDWAVVAGGDTGPTGAVAGRLFLSPAEFAAVRAALLQGQSLRLDRPGGAVVTAPFDRPLRLIIVGGVHIAQALARMAAAVDITVTIIDPRSGFATPERFPGAALSADWPDDAVRALDPDPGTAVVTLAHDPRLDDPALLTALGSGAFYVGALGSRRSHALRRKRLAAAGVEPAAIDRIRAPVGLDLGGRRPAEIAVAILAEVLAVRYGRAFAWR